jgi:adenosylhomocysteinase
MPSPANLLTSQESIISDPELSTSGYRKLEWVKNNMPVLNNLYSEFAKDKPLAGKTVACCLHLEAKTGYLLQTLNIAGAKVVACASNPLSTQDDVVAALVNSGINIFARRGESEKNTFNLWKWPWIFA